MPDISAHISYAEATKSPEAIRSGIDNLPNFDQLEAMQYVAEHCFEPLRAHHGAPIAITSFFRSAALNAAIGGARNSAHMRGEAIDIDADVFDNGLTNAEVFNWLLANVDFDQLIWEFGDKMNPAWVHVAARRSGNRKDVLRAVRRVEDGVMRTRYLPYLP